MLVSGVRAECIREVEGVDPRALPDEVLESTEPLVLRGLAADWPMVRAALESPAAATAYLRRFYKDAIGMVISGDPAIGGRFFYNDDLSGFNSKTYRTGLDGVPGTTCSTRVTKPRRTFLKPRGARSARWKPTSCASCVQSSLRGSIARRGSHAEPE
jgi:hypothetical protein